jgi:hypothetical protein
MPSEHAGGYNGQHAKEFVVIANNGPQEPTALHGRHGRHTVAPQTTDQYNAPQLVKGQEGEDAFERVAIEHG